MTLSTVEMKRAVPDTSALARNTLSPVPTTGRPRSSVSWAPDSAGPASVVLYFSGSSWIDTTADISNR